MCKSVRTPVVLLPPHGAPLGLAYYHGDMFPQLEGRLLVTLHGYRATGSRILLTEPLFAQALGKEIARQERKPLLFVEVNTASSTPGVVGVSVIATVQSCVVSPFVTHAGAPSV